MKLIKKVMIFLIAALLIFVFIGNVYSVTEEQIKTFSGTTENVGDAKNATSQVINGLISATRVIGAAIAIIILMVIASKYILASAGDRADIKKYAVNYIIGAVILFAATGILGIIQTFVFEAVGTETTPSE